MSAKMAVPESMLEPVGKFVATEGIPLDVVVGDGAPVRVVQAAEGQQSSASLLQAGGWIACGTAFEMAARLGVTTRDIGKLLNHLDIRIRACQLGCFE